MLWFSLHWYKPISLRCTLLKPGNGADLLNWALWYHWCSEYSRSSWNGVSYSSGSSNGWWLHGREPQAQTAYPPPVSALLNQRWQQLMQRTINQSHIIICYNFGWQNSRTKYLSAKQSMTIVGGFFKICSYVIKTLLYQSSLLYGFSPNRH